MNRARHAFTMVELMVAIVIVIILASILMVAVSRSMGAGRRVRAQADLQTIATALEAYKQDFGDYPRPTAATGPFDSSSILCRVLVAPDLAAVDGADGPGFRIRGTQGKVYGPYIDSSAFDIDITNYYVRSKVYAASDAGPIPPILYIPRNVRPIQPTDPVNHYVDTNANAMYDVTSLGNALNRNAVTLAWWPTIPANPSGTLAPLAQVQRMMGNTSLTGYINGAEVPAFTGPYILWIAGPDGVFGLANSRGSRSVADGAYSTDDIANFNFDPAITVK